MEFNARACASAVTRVAGERVSAIGRRLRSALAIASAVCAIAPLAACTRPEQGPRPGEAAELGIGSGATRANVYASIRMKTALGEELFFDPSLSGSGKLACASCHSPAHAFGPPNALSVQLGGTDLRQPGYRAVPTLMYSQWVPAFSEHYHDSDDEGDESVDAGPTGGLTWAGRDDTHRAQTAVPLLSPF